MMIDVALYAHALTAAAAFCVLSLLLGAQSARGRKPEDRAACGKPIRNYDNKWYRSERAFANAIENSGPIIGAIVVAVLVGAHPLTVNLLASVILVARIAMAVVHITTINQALRSVFFGIATLANLGLAIVALIGAISL